MLQLDIAETPVRNRNRSRRQRGLTPAALPIPLAILIALSASLVGCAYGSKEMHITVRDAATATPVNGALVQITPLHLFIPDPINKTIDPSPPPGTFRTTRPDGTVRFTGVLGVPTRLRAFAPGYAPLQLYAVHRRTRDGAFRWEIDNPPQPWQRNAPPQLTVHLGP